MIEKRQSKHDIDLLLFRLKHTDEKSPLLVKIIEKGMFDVKFARTIESAKEIAAKGKDILGVYHKNNIQKFLIDSCCE